MVPTIQHFSPYHFTIYLAEHEDEIIPTGVLTDAERKAVNLFAKHEGLLLDPGSTGRAAVGMIDLIRKRFFKKDETMLFWHTGGKLALFAEKYATRI